MTRRLRAAGLLACAAASCGQTRSSAEQRAEKAERGGGEVVVAAVFPWTAHPEIQFRQGLEMAAEQINAGGGVNGRPLRLRFHDDQGSVDEGRLVAQRIAADPDVVAVIGHLQSYVTVPAAAIYDLAGLLLIAPTATDAELTTQGYQRVFRATFTDKDTGHQLAESVAKRHQRAAIYYVRNAYGRGLANAFEERASELGLATVARQSYDPADQVRARTFEPTLRLWKSLELDALFVAGEIPAAATLVAEARTQGVAAAIYGGDALSSPALMKLAGAAAEGAVVTAFFHPEDPRPEVARFTAAFKSRHGGLIPDAGAALGHDALHLFARAATHARSTAPDRVARALRELPPWSGATGPFRFDERGANIARQPVKTEVRDGRFVFLRE